jgi:hypothetical protein
MIEIRLLGFTTLHDSRDATQFRNAWDPHRTPRHKGGTVCTQGVRGDDDTPL